MYKGNDHVDSPPERLKKEHIGNFVEVWYGSTTNSAAWARFELAAKSATSARDNTEGAAAGTFGTMRSAELFVGAGGLGIGVSLAGFRPAAVLDKDRWACDTLRENKANRLKPISHWPIHEVDVRKFDFTSIDGNVDLVTGGPPCQPFSMGGRHRAFLDDRDMFSEAVRALRELKPRAFIFENVKGLMRARFLNYVEYIQLQMTYPELTSKPNEGWRKHLGRLENHHTSGKDDGLRYNVVKQVLNSADFGVPQKRERVFFVGFRSDIEVCWHFPACTHSRDALLWSQWRSGDYWDRHKISRNRRPQDSLSRKIAEKIASKPKLAPWTTVRDAICDLPDPESQPDKAALYHNHKLQPGARIYPGHTGSPLDEPAKTLKAGVHGVPGGENMLRNLDGSVRYFTVRESARLQTFPDGMSFRGSWTESMRQLGNAVPVEMARIVARDVHRKIQAAA